MPHKTQLSRSRVKLDMLLMHLRQSEFGNSGVPCFIYLSSDASPQGSLEFYITLEDKVSRSSAALLVEATADERSRWVKAGHLRTTCLPVAILGSGKSNAPAKFEALTHSVILDSMSGGEPRNVSAYGNSVVSPVHRILILINKVIHFSVDIEY